jgi:GAF domain-containing protein
VLNIALEKVIKLMDLDRGFILSHDDSGCMDIAAHFGIPKICMDKSTHFPRNKCICNYVKETGKIVFANDEYVCSLKDIIIPDGLHNFVCVPLASSNKLLGTMILIYRLDRTFSMSEIDMLESLGNTIGTAIENSTLYADSEIMVDMFEEKVRERTQVLEATFNMSKVINSELKLESLLTRIVKEVVAATNADSCAISIIDHEKNIEYLFKFKADADSCDHFEIELDKNDISGIADTKRDDIAEENNNGGFLSITIKNRHKVIGILSIYKSVISSEDKALLHNVADQAGFAMGNAQMYEMIAEHANELKKLNKFMVNRELKMVELKNNIRQLEDKLTCMPTGN